MTIGSNGLFITLEGPDGAGKSSQAGLLAERIRALGREVVLTREPGGTQMGERVRQVLMDVRGGGHDGMSDALLFNAARRRHTIEVIRPALTRGSIVVCDRYTDSTLAYQGYGDGIRLDLLRVITGAATDGLVPTRTVLVDLPVELGLARKHGGVAGDLTRFELQGEHGQAFHERVRAGYFELAGNEPGRWRVVNGAAERDAVAAEIWAAVSDLF
jgi:dTMP kinase